MLKPELVLILLQSFHVVLEQHEIFQGACWVEAPIANTCIPHSFASTPTVVLQAVPDTKSRVTIRAWLRIGNICFQGQQLRC